MPISCHAYTYTYSYTYNYNYTKSPMYNPNSDHHHHHHQMSPRISFSNDFAESAQYPRQQLINPRHGQPPPTPLPPPPSDFEFSVSNYSMMSADELFCKGRLLPYQNNGTVVGQKTTLRQELLAGEDEDDGGGVSFRPPKGSSTRWKGFLGRSRKSHIGSKKSDKIDEKTGNVTNTSSQEMMNEGGSSSSSSCREVEFRMN